MDLLDDMGMSPERSGGRCTVSINEEQIKQWQEKLNRIEALTLQVSGEKQALYEKVERQRDAMTGALAVIDTDTAKAKQILQENLPRNDKAPLRQEKP